MPRSAANGRGNEVDGGGRVSSGFAAALSMGGATDVGGTVRIPHPTVHHNHIYAP